MTGTAQLRHERTDISAYFAPEIITPLQPKKNILVFMDTASRGSSFDEWEYKLAKHLDQPVYLHHVDLDLKQVKPRGIPWNDFPIVSDPFYRIDLQPASKQTRWLGFDEVNLATLLDHADDIALLTDYDTRHQELYTPSSRSASSKLSYLLDKLRSKHETALHLESTGFTRSTREQLAYHRKAELRFMYSYEVNFTAIALKAVRALVPEGYERPSGDFMESFKGIHFNHDEGLRHFYVEGLDHPLALQWLYRLKKIGVFDASYATDEDYSGSRNERLFSLSESANGTAWVGSGKHAPWVPDARVFGVAPAFIKMGLAEYDFYEKTIKVSDRGYRFLDMLHPDCEDPDVIMRWLDPKTGLFRDDVEQSCDGWIMRFFSKMKTKVNLIETCLHRRRPPVNEAVVYSTTQAYDFIFGWLEAYILETFDVCCRSTKEEALDLQAFFLF